jgi:hypothetical protein
LKINRKVLITCTIIVLVLSIGAIYAVNADGGEQGLEKDHEEGVFPLRGWRMRFRAFKGSLTEEQRNELASEIEDLIALKCEEWGLELPEPLLTDDQRYELREYVNELRDGGMSPQEIREKVAEKLEEWGVELPEFPEHSCRFQRRGRFLKKPFGGMWKDQPGDEEN